VFSMLVARGGGSGHDAKEQKFNALTGRVCRRLGSFRWHVVLSVSSMGKREENVASLSRGRCQTSS